MHGYLTYFGRPLPDNCRVGCSHFVSLREVAVGETDLDRLIEGRAVSAIAEQIVATRTVKIPGKYNVEYRTDVYVFSPDQFWQIVEEAASAIIRAEREAAKGEGAPVTDPGVTSSVG